MPADAEDATQEVFLHLWRTAGQYDATRGSESIFIITLARRVLISRYRSKQRSVREVPVEELEGVDWEPVASAAPEDHLEARLAAQALASLPADQRRVIEMSVVGGLSQSEIARHTGLPLGTVKTFMRRGLMLVREKLNREGAGRHMGVGA
jgi:RNA polymerase sigma-70 factor (ECF subfamily)